jgi:hypothetical protein
MNEEAMACVGTQRQKNKKSTDTFKITIFVIVLL